MTAKLPKRGEGALWNAPSLEGRPLSAPDPLLGPALDGMGLLFRRWETASDRRRPLSTPKQSLPEQAAYSYDLSL
jgi:hypothetical protein